MYYVINNQPVFLYTERNKIIREEALKGKDSTFAFSSMIAGRKENEEAQALIYDTLLDKCKQNEKQFYENWIKFDICGEIASQETWTLLYDYCHYYGYAYLIDLRNEQNKLIDDLMGYSNNCPMGEVFALCHDVKPNRWWWKFTAKMNGRTIKVIINTNRVYRLKGTLSEFILFSKDYTIKCGKEFEIITADYLLGL